MEWFERVAASLPVSYAEVDGRQAAWLSGPAQFGEHVVGEIECQTHLAAVAAGRVGPNYSLRVSAWLLPEPENPTDPFTVRVVVSQGRVGDLASPRAELWQPVLLALARQHSRYVACPASIFVDTTPFPHLAVGVFLPIALDETPAREQAALNLEEARRTRENAFLSRFGRGDAERLLRGELWQGATREMVVALLGEPVDVDEKVTKRAVVHVLKYRPRPGRRYGLRVTLEGGVVVGWEEKA